MAKSIIQTNRDRCYLCGRPALYNDPLDKHHVFFGPYRKKSEKYGLTVYLHHFSCHIFGENAVHNNAEVCRDLQSEVQEIAMKHYGWTIGDFIRRFGRNYIDNYGNSIEDVAIAFNLMANAASRVYGVTLAELDESKPIIEAKNHCVMCGEIIPEGRQVCTLCEREE